MKTVDLPTAKALQELGYDGECNRWYNQDGKLKPTHLVDDDIPAPRLDDVAYWIRDKQGILIYITYLPSERQYLYHLSVMDGYYDLSEQWKNWTPTTDYDSALEAAVKKAIEIIKDKKQ